MKENIKIDVIIVLYNKHISESITYQCISHEFDIRIICVDNSETDMGSQSFCHSHNVECIYMHGNKGLSKAYNAALNICVGDWIVIFDDDTHVPKDYFSKLREAIVRSPDCDIFTPLVYGIDGVIYSPNKFHFLRNHFIKRPDEPIPQENYNAISSGLAIHHSVFDYYRFHEALFVDQVDQYFFCEQRKRGKQFRKLNVIIHQNFYQRGTDLNPEIIWRRLKLRIPDIMCHAILMGKKSYIKLGILKNFGLSIQMALKTKSLKLLIRAIHLSVIQIIEIPKIKLKIKECEQNRLYFYKRKIGFRGE